MNVYLVSPENREIGVRTLLEQVDFQMFKNKKVAVKANFNSADPFPGSTHPGTLTALLSSLASVNADIVVAERSGMGKTNKVLRALHIPDVVSRYGEMVVIDDLDGEGFSRFHGEHWRRGFLLAQPFLDADYVISTCCLKTHRFGGHFSFSLKNTVGAIARVDPEDGYDYMGELHQSPYQRTMIAEINKAFSCDLVILDAMRGFSTMGPEQGHIIEPGVLLASEDRVAIDAVGVSLLRLHGTTPEVERGSVFDQEQIKRAAELHIGVTSSEKISLVPLDKKSEHLARKLTVT
ncbi:MAG: DUF362 domain-containing protein [Theionarchaea archaeon]|nr:DUF362 domain-containing protein [Theionarchaea archaeon]MBU7020774.1 DUF362 domain-containing protein [Theionarchaea archaeon]MBU7035634.1 DUF362 domain-containing protein [Theionarchaea archaeon]MBU7041163.1 DUF362 domain-containing protein [Theionarchaea archaeon]